MNLALYAYTSPEISASLAKHDLGEISGPKTTDDKRLSNAEEENSHLNGSRSFGVSGLAPNENELRGTCVDTSSKITDYEVARGT